MHTRTHAHKTHTHPQTNTQTHGNWRCWRRPDSTVSKLGYTTEGNGWTGHLGGPAIESFIALEEPLGTDVFGMGGRARMEAGRDWRAVYRRVRSCVTTSNLECKNSQINDACASAFPLKRPFQSSLVTPTPPVVCYSRDRTPPATRITRGPLWRPMFSCSQEGAAAYRGLFSTKLGPVMARPGRRRAGGAMPETLLSGTHAGHPG